MTLKQLTTFYWVCRLGSFAAAAEYLFSTQSAVSMRIRELETSLGVELFDRSLRAARLTPKGRDLIKHVEQIMAVTNEIERSIASPDNLVGTVTIGATELVAITWLPSLVAAMHERCPNVFLKLDLDSAMNQTRKLERGAIDVAILPGPTAGSKYTNVFLEEVEFCWVAGGKNKVLKSRHTPEDLLSYQILTLAAESFSYKLVESWFKKSDIIMERHYIANSLSVLAELAASGVGITYLPVTAFEHYFRDGRLKVLDVHPCLPTLDYYLVFEERVAHPAVYIVSELAQSLSDFDIKRQ